MNDVERGDARPPGRLLTAGELSARRGAWRDRRRRRRRAGVAVALAVGLVVLAVALTRGGASSHRPPTSAAGSADASVRAVRLAVGVRRRAAGEHHAVDRVLGYTSYVELAG